MCVCVCVCVCIILGGRQIRFLVHLLILQMLIRVLRTLIRWVNVIFRG